MTDLRYQKQNYRHDPDGAGTWGDCARTVLACLLHIPRDDVPHFFFNNEIETNQDMMQFWLKARGLRIVYVPFSGHQTKPQEIISTISNINPGVRWMLIGESKTGVNHVVICKDGKIDHDPSLDDSGIVGPDTEDGVYWMAVLIPVNLPDFIGLFTPKD